MADFAKPRQKGKFVASRYLYVAGIGERLGHNECEVAELLRKPLMSAGLNIPSIHMAEGMAFIFLSFDTVDDASRARCALDQCTVVDDAKSVAQKGRRLMVTFAERKAAPRPLTQQLIADCPLVPSETIPGLMLLPNFISTEQEYSLMSSVEKFPWDETLARRVQHYGFTFNYGLRACHSTAPPMPPQFKSIVNKLMQPLDLNGSKTTRVNEKQYPATDPLIPRNLCPNQCTVNQYLPGQGIASHVDTHAAFDDAIISLSMGSGIVMEFRRERRAARTSKIRQKELLPLDYRDLPTAQFVPQKDDNDNSGDMNEEIGDDCPNRVLVYLPSRSLLVLRSDARYKWEHRIASRSWDRINGELIKRDIRVSLTFRRIMPPGTKCRCGCGDTAPDVSTMKEASTAAETPEVLTEITQASSTGTNKFHATHRD